jgi:hypothetical protein
LFNEYLGSYSDMLLLEPGITQDFSLFDEEAYSYDVWTAPVQGGVSDVDFFTFTGLTAGASFTIETVDTGGINIDTYLGWFDSGGGLIDANDDIDYDNGIYQSMLSGTVPAGGTLTFAVTGFGDEDFDGSHDIDGAYELLLDVEGAVLDGDYNADGHVDTADYVTWRKGAASGDYATWRTHFGEPNGGAGGDFSSSGSVPEPALIAPVTAWVIIGITARRRRRVAALS